VCVVFTSHFMVKAHRPCETKTITNKEQHAVAAAVSLFPSDAMAAKEKTFAKKSEDRRRQRAAAAQRKKDNQPPAKIGLKIGHPRDEQPTS